MIEVNSNEINPESQQRKKVNLQQDLQASHYILRRIFYASILIAFLLVISFYFDLLQDYDVLSLLLGFVVCIILQFSFLSYYFQNEMKKYKMDEIGIIKWKIKLLFGELFMQHVQKKNRIKYYRHEGNQNDRLFSEQNQGIYQNVMTYLRGKQQINFNDLIQKSKVKWQFLDNKITLMQQFLGSILNQFQNRRSIYNRYKNIILKLKQKQQYKDWSNFMRQQPSKIMQTRDNFNNTSYYSQNLDELTPGISSHSQNEQDMLWKINLNWGLVNWYILQKIKLNQKQIRDIKTYIVEQFNGFAQTIKKAKQVAAKKRQKLFLTDYKTAKDQQDRILRDIQKTTEKILSLQQMLQNNRLKQGEQVQGILKYEFDLRLLKIQLQNMEIKISRAKSFTLLNSELLYTQLQKQSKQLQDYLQIFNGKINQYINQMVGFGQNRIPDIKSYIEELKKQKAFEIQPNGINEQSDIDSIFLKYYGRKKNQSSFRNYLAEILNLFKQLRNNSCQGEDIMLKFKKKFQQASSNKAKNNQNRFKIQFNGAKLHYYASSVNDQKILRMFQTINYFEQKVIQKIVDAITEQTKTVAKFEEQIGTKISKDLKKYQDQFKRKDQQVKKLRKKGIVEENTLSKEDSYMQMNKLKQTIFEEILKYSENNKIESYLIYLIKLMIQSQQQYEKYAHEVDAEEKYQLQTRQQINGDDRRRQKYQAYINCISKRQIQQFDDDNLMKDDNFSLFGDTTKINYEQSKGKAMNQIQIWNLSSFALKQQFIKPKYRQTQKIGQLYTYKQSTAKSSEMINKLLGVLFNQWSNSQFFHQIIKQEILTSLNKKKPDIIQNLNIQYFKIVEKDKSINPIKNIKVHNCQIYRCMLDFTIDFKGKIAVQLGSKLKISKKPGLQIKLLIQQFQCPIRLCFTPFSLGKSYASLLDRPKLSIQYSVSLGGYSITKIPFFSQIIKTYIVLKLRKKMLWPKRMTLSIPLAFKSTLQLAIQQRFEYERDKQRMQKKGK